jgi:hypothetical protein
MDDLEPPIFEKREVLPYPVTGGIRCGLNVMGEEQDALFHARRLIHYIICPAIGSGRQHRPQGQPSGTSLPFDLSLVMALKT